MGVEVDPGVCCEGTEVALVYQAFLISRENELEFASLFNFNVSIYCIPIADNAGGISIGIVKNAVVENLKSFQLN
jgi:hypothetical protein